MFFNSQQMASRNSKVEENWSWLKQLMQASSWSHNKTIEACKQYKHSSRCGYSKKKILGKKTLFWYQVV